MFADLTIKNRIILTIGFVNLLLVGIAVTGWQGLYRNNESLRTVFDDRVVPLTQLSDIQRLMAENRLQLALAAAKTGNPDGKAATVKSNLQRIDEIWAAYMATYLTPEEAVLAKQFSADYTNYRKEFMDLATPLVRSGDGAGLTALLTGKDEASSRPVLEGIGKLIQLQVDVSKQEYDGAKERASTILIGVMAILAVSMLVSSYLGIALFRAVVVPLRTAKGYFERMATGDLNVDITIDRQDEITQILEVAQTMQGKLKGDMAAMEIKAEEAGRVRDALDDVMTGVMIADKDRKLVYVNKSVQKLLQSAEASIRKQLPSFSVDNLVGGNIDQYHKNPAHQAQMLSALNSTYVAKLEIGGRKLRVVANPLFNERRERIGTVAEWNDQTQEIAIQEEVGSIVDAAVAGDFSRRIDLKGKEGFFKQLAEGINRLLETSEKGLEEVSQVMSRLAEGDLTHRMEGQYEGRFADLQADANRTITQLTDIVSQIQEATEAITTASREIASGNADLSHRTEEQASSLEETASSVEQLSSTVKQNADNARQANQMAVAASDVALKGGSVVDQVVGTMNAINDSSRKIVDIISVIDGIAFQTNILALNAAVEAARAGEQGRGFAVVAGEVRNLAQRSAAAAKEIKGLIGDSVEKVDTGSELVSQAGLTMKEIVSSVKRVTDIMGEISAASLEQSSGIDQINNAVTHIDEVTQQNAALVEEAAAAAQSMQEQAQNLSRSVGRFRLAGEARRAAPRSLPLPAARKTTLTAKAVTVVDDEWSEF